MTTVRMADGAVRDMDSFGPGEFLVACQKRQVLAVIEPITQPRANVVPFQPRAHRDPIAGCPQPETDWKPAA